MKKSIKFLSICALPLLMSGCNTPANNGNDVSIIEDKEWQDFSSEKVNAANAFLLKASQEESKITTNTISNGVISEGISSYSSYSFKKGKRSNNELACYHKSPSQTAYYYYENNEINGYVEKGTDSNKSYSKATGLIDKKFDGYDMSSLMIKASGIYGGYASLQKMFDNGSANENKDTKFMIKNDGFDMKYSLYSKVSYTYWGAEISARFSNNGALTSLRYKYVESYAKNVNKNEDGTFTFKPDADLKYKETIYEATFTDLGSLELSIDPDNFYYSSYDLYDGSTLISEGATISPTIGEDGVVIDVKNSLPSTAISAIDSWTISTKQEGKKANTDDNYFDSKESKIYLGAIRSSGTYEVSVTTKKIVKNFTVDIGKIAPESITFSGVKVEDRGASLIDLVSTITANSETNICAYINPIEANQDITLTVNPSNGITESDYSLVQHTFISTNTTLKYYTFASSKPGTFVFNAISNEDNQVSASHTLNVINPLSPDEVFNGKYCLINSYTKTLIYTFEFTPNASTDAVDGMCLITSTVNGKYGIYTYSAPRGSNVISLTYKSDETGTTEILYKVSFTSNGTRNGLIVKCSDSPVEWETTYSLVDWNYSLTNQSN